VAHNPLMRLCSPNVDAFEPSNPDLDNILLHVFARNYVFRLLIFERRKFNET